MNETYSSSLKGADHVLSSFPFYYSPRQHLLQDIPDVYLAVAGPVLAYWSLSLVFHALDMSTDPRLEKYRIHPSAEVTSKNLASRTRVLVAVLLQQLVQTALGLYWIDDVHAPITHLDHVEKIVAMRESVSPWLSMVLGETTTNALLTISGGAVLYFAYWWAIPVAQFLLASVIIDTWQYFLHRLMHVNKFLYKHFHSVHHRLYVPYAFGALYNHPVEGFLLDSLGAALAEWLTGMNTRQAMLLFSFSTFKTVDDHCGYNFPWDPLQLMSGNNADYHDIHHQAIGIKANFAQPFFVHWDTVLGTRMTRADIAERKAQYKNKSI